MIDPPARRPLAALTCVLFLGLSACYAYTPVDDGRPEAGSEVRLRLNDEGADRVAGQTVFSKRTVLEGRIVEDRVSELLVFISRPARRAFVSGGRRSDTVSVPLTGIEAVELKQVETGKTAALFGGVAVGLGLIAGVLVSGGGSGGAPPGDDGGQPFNISVPVSIP